MRGRPYPDAKRMHEMDMNTWATLLPGGYLSTQNAMIDILRDSKYPSPQLSTHSRTTKLPEMVLK